MRRREFTERLIRNGSSGFRRFTKRHSTCSAKQPACPPAACARRVFDSRRLCHDDGSRAGRRRGRKRSREKRRDRCRGQGPGSAGRGDRRAANHRAAGISRHALAHVDDILASIAGNKTEDGNFPVTTRYGKAMSRSTCTAPRTGRSGSDQYRLTTVGDNCHNVRSHDHAVYDIGALQETGVRCRWSYGPYRACPRTSTSISRI